MEFDIGITILLVSAIWLDCLTLWPHRALLELHKQETQMNQTKFSEEAVQSFQILDLTLLIAAVNGKIDLNEMVKNELKSRGLDETGKWVGFK